jgi:hypothetical protein
VKVTVVLALVYTRASPPYGTYYFKIAYRAARDRERAFFNKFSTLIFLLKISRIPGARLSARLLLLCHVDDFCARLPTLHNGDTAAWPAAKVWPLVAHPFERWQPVLLAAGSKLLGAAGGGLVLLGGVPGGRFCESYIFERSY